MIIVQKQLQYCDISYDNTDNTNNKKGIRIIVVVMKYPSSEYQSP